MSDRYYGPDKVALSEIVVGEETPAKDQVVKVTFESGQVRMLSKTAFELFTTDEPIDHTELSNRKQLIATNKFIDVAAEFDITGLEAQQFVLKCGNAMMDAFDRTSHYLWEGRIDNWNEGASYTMNKSILEAWLKVSDAVKEAKKVKKDESKKSK